jgi:hypothetical protein
VVIYAIFIRKAEPQSHDIWLMDVVLTTIGRSNIKERKTIVRICELQPSIKPVAA